MSSPAEKRFIKAYRPVYDAVARANITQVDREDIAKDIADGFDAAKAKDFWRDTFVLLASDPLCTCAGPSATEFETPCPHGREIRVGMHLSTAPDGRAESWRATKPTVRCVTCGSAVFLAEQAS